MASIETRVKKVRLDSDDSDDEVAVERMDVPKSPAPQTSATIEEFMGKDPININGETVTMAQHNAKFRRLCGSDPENNGAFKILNDPAFVLSNESIVYWSDNSYRLSQILEYVTADRLDQRVKTTVVHKKTPLYNRTLMECLCVMFAWSGDLKHILHLLAVYEGTVTPQFVGLIIETALTSSQMGNESVVEALKDRPNVLSTGLAFDPMNYPHYLVDAGTLQSVREYVKLHPEQGLELYYFAKDRSSPSAEVRAFLQTLGPGVYSYRRYPGDDQPDSDEERLLTKLLIRVAKRLLQ